MVSRKGALRVRDVGESGLLRRIRRYLADPGPGVILGVGDDAALIRSIGPAAVLSSDMIIEGIDFDLRWAPFRDVGHKAAAINLSDLAAMGATPRGLLLSIGVRPADRVVDVMRLVDGCAKAGGARGAPLVGGDLSRIDGPLVVSVTAVGQLEAKKALRRHGGRAGDVIMVSGTLGGAAAGLHILRKLDPRRPALRRRQLRPQPQIELGVALARWGRVRGCADVSDGLATDALHAVEEGLGVALDPEAVPIQSGVQAIARAHRRSAVELALCGGEDFELVIAVRPADVGQAEKLAKRIGTRLTAVGRVTKKRGVHMIDGSALGGGFDHFKG